MEEMLRYYMESPAVVQFILGLCVVLALFWLLFTLAIIILKPIRNVRRNRLLKCKQEAYEFVQLKAFEESHNVLDSIDNRLLNTSNKRQVWIDVLLEMKASFAGEVAVNVVKIYHDIGLSKDSLRKIKANKTHIKAKGIIELSAMEHESAVSVAANYVSHKDVILRQEAQLAVVRGLGIAGLDIFVGNNSALSKWQILCLLNVLRGKQNLDELNNELFASTNSDVTLLVIRIVVEFGMYQHASDLAVHRKSEHTVIRLEVARMIKSLNQFQMADRLNEWLLVERDVQVKCAIIGAMSEIRNEKTFSLLVKALESEQFRIRYAATRSLKDEKLRLEESNLKYDKKLMERVIREGVV